MADEQTTPPAGTESPAVVVDPATPPIVEPPKSELGGEPPKTPEAPPAFDAAKLQLPEGMKTDDPLFQSYTETLADDKLTPQERGQKLLDIYRDGVKQIQDANTRAWNETNENWIKAVKADPDIGGANFAKTKTAIARAIDSFGTAEAAAFRQALDVTGAGNHPAIWKGLSKLAALVTEGSHVAGDPPKSAGTAKDFFPNSQMSG